MNGFLVSRLEECGGNVAFLFLLDFVSSVFPFSIHQGSDKHIPGGSQVADEVSEREFAVTGESIDSVCGDGVDEMQCATADSVEIIDESIDTL